MGDVASLAVGLHLNAANFKSQLIGAYGDAEGQSRKFNRSTQDDAKKTDAAYAKVGSTITGLAGRLAAFAGVGLSLGSIINTSRQYGQALSDLSAITGSTGEQLKSLDAAAQEMGRTTEYSASQAVEALKLMASAKPELLETADGLTQATKSALVLAQAAGSTLPDATKTLALSLNQFGAGADQADRYINVLAAGAKYGASEIADTAAAIKNGGVAAAQAGVGFEQLNAAIQVLASREIKGGEAGTALRNVILQLEKGTDKTLKPSVVGLSTALENLSKKNLSTAQAVKVFGLENINAASILVDNRKNLDDLTKSLTGTQTAHEQASVRVNNLNGDLMGLTSAFEGLIIKVGQSGNGPLRSGVQSITEAVGLLSDNFNAVASVALYTLIPVLATKLTAGIRSSTAEWVANQKAVRESANAQAEIAKKTIETTKAALARNDADYAGYRLLEKNAQQHGYLIKYNEDFNRLGRQELELVRTQDAAKLSLAAANRQVSVSARAMAAAVGLAKGALSLVGGPVGAAMLAGSAIFYLHQQNVQARQSALGLKDAVVETTAALMQLSDKQLAVKQLDLQDQYQNQITQKNQIVKEIQDADSRISSLQSFDPFGQLSGVQSGKVRAEAQLEDVKKGIDKAKDSLDNVNKARFLVQTNIAGFANNLASDVKAITAAGKAADGAASPWGGEDPAKADKKGQQALKTYKQLRLEIEKEHASSLAKIDIEEKAAQQKLIETAKAAGVAQSVVQKLVLLNAQNYQRQRMDLAEQYSPARATLRKEQETSRDLKQLFDARLLTEKEYQAARLNLSQSSTRDILKAQADIIAAPKQNIAGEVDPVAQLQNQLAQQQALYQAYYDNGRINKEQYESLMAKASEDSAEAQYNAALSLYTGQSRLNKLSIGLVDTVKERMTNTLTGLLNGTKDFKDGMSSLFASLSQTIIQNLIDMGTQALLTRTILSSFMSFGGAAAGGGASAAGSGAGAMGMGTSFGSYVANAKGGVYSSPDLSGYSNTVVSSPTMFAFAKGAGLMGESGPEAIMPLTRAANGSLGVRSIGDSNATMSGNYPAPQITLNIYGGEQGTDNVQSSSGFEQMGTELMKLAQRTYVEMRNKDLRPGGALWRNARST
ncbi:phage tail tape measure protein [Ewingella allii]|uniref:phage tail tape measure protein n=1 Tax=Ewingella allii TaxID=3092550 RepID=UPI0037AA3878